MIKNEEIVVLYSGGTDSTLTAALVAEEFRKVHLVTYDRFGFFSVRNPAVNVRKLRDKYKENEFVHETIRIEKITKYVFYETYFKNLIKYGFFLLSNCGLCKLAMHVRTVIYCLDNDIKHVCDGANQGMNLFPAQMKRVISDVKNMYARFGIKYTNPVFDFEGPQDIEFADRLHLENILPTEEKDEGHLEKKKKTTGYKLYELGLMPSENVKGTELDRGMQPRCFQFILFNIFLHWYYLHNHTYEQYEEATVRFFRDKTERFTELLDDYMEEDEASRLYKLVEA